MERYELAIAFLRRMAPAQSHEGRHEFEAAVGALLEARARERPDTMPAGWNRPMAASKDDLLEALEGALAHVRADDSFEGFVEWSMPIPGPCEACHGTGKFFKADCVRCGGSGVRWEDPRMSEAAFGLRARYRVGNSMGQGGMRVFADHAE